VKKNYGKNWGIFMSWKDEIRKNEQFLTDMKTYKQMGIIDHFKSIERIKTLVKEDAGESDIVEALSNLQKHLAKQNDSIIDKIQYAYEAGMRNA